MSKNNITNIILNRTSLITWSFTINIILNKESNKDPIYEIIEYSINIDAPANLELDRDYMLWLAEIDSPQYIQFMKLINCLNLTFKQFIRKCRFLTYQSSNYLIFLNGMNNYVLPDFENDFCDDDFIIH